MALALPKRARPMLDEGADAAARDAAAGVGAAFRRALPAPLLFALCYLAGAGVAELFVLNPGTAITIWPPSGVFVATLACSRRADWPRWIAAGLLAELAANLLWFGNPLPLALAIVAGNALEASLAALLLRRGRPDGFRLERLSDVLRLVFLGAGVAPLASATIGAGALAVAGIQPFAASFPLWWVGDATGVLIVAPLVVLVVAGRYRALRPPARRLVEAGLLGVAFAAVALLCFGGWLSFAYLMMPVLLWIAVRFRLEGAALAAPTLAATAAALTLAGAGEFASDPAGFALQHLMLQLFIAISALVMLVVAALAREHEAALATLAADNRQLEDRVAARTQELQRSEVELRILNESLEQRVAAAVRDREAAALQLAQAQKMEAMGELTGGLAHDFNNLLTVIAGNLDRIADGAADPARVRQLAAAAAKAADRGTRLVETLLAAARRQPLRSEVADVRALLAEFAPIIRQAMGEEVRLEISADASLPRCILDPTQFQVAILNLAINGRDAMTGGGTLTIGCSERRLGHDDLAGNPDAAPGRFVAVAVADTGAGMPPEVLARAVDPFFTTKPVGKGSGLGLSQVHGLTRQLGGHMTIGSAPGAGTTVTLCFPVAPEAETPLI